ncbi:MAG: GNAT family N-acetyltransferase [Candidatus Nanopelagicales bacterium]
MIVGLGRADLDTLLGWAADEGWNPGDEAEVFWNTDPHAYMGVRDDAGRLIGGLATVDYGGRLGAMGLFIVSQSHRGRGLGRQLWYHGRDSLLERLDPGAAIAIDAVPAMAGFYRDSGFAATHDHRRMRILTAPEDVPDAVRRIRAPLGSLPDLDSRCFGAPRPMFLASWLAQSDHTAVAFVDDRLRGYGVLRPCRHGYKVGPLFAESDDVADALFRGLAAATPAGSEIFVDVPSVNESAVRWAASLGGQEVFACARMYYGAPPAVDWSSVYGVTTLELG